MHCLQELTIVVSGFDSPDCAASNTSSTISQSSSVIFVSMTGSLMPVFHESKKSRFGIPSLLFSLSVHRA
jgi:hypothetical protein